MDEFEEETRAVSGPIAPKRKLIPLGWCREEERGEEEGWEEEGWKEWGVAGEKEGEWDDDDEEEEEKEVWEEEENEEEEEEEEVVECDEVFTG